MDQNAFFKKPAPIQPENKDDGSGSDSDHEHGPHRRHRKKHRHSDSDSSSDDAESTDIVRIKKKKEKKLRRDANLSITSPLALGLKYLTTESAARAASYEQAILLRAIRPNNTTLPQILKNDKLIKWDDMLVLNAVKKLFSHQVKHLRYHKLKDKASKLYSMGRDVNIMMMEDLLLITATAMYAVMTALWTQDPSGMKICERSQVQSPAFTTDPNNRVRNLADLSGLCIGFNFKFDGCSNPDCPYLHICAFHPTEQLQHPSMRCTKNPNRWKSKKSNNNNNYNNNSRRGRGRHHQHHHNNHNHNNHNNYNNWPNQYPPYYPQQFTPFVHNQFPQLPPNQYPPIPPNDNNPRSNKDRFFGPKK